MKIRLDYDVMSKELDLFKGLLGKKSLQEDMRVINILKEGETLQMVGVDPEVLCMTEIDGEYDTEGLAEDWSVALSVKELQDNLNKFRGLQRTQVAYIELEILENGVILSVVEEAKDSEIENAELYDQTTAFKIGKKSVSNYAKKEISEISDIDLEESLETLDTLSLRRYLEYYQPLMANHLMDETIHFKENDVMAVIGNRYGVKMENVLPETFRDISMSKFVVGFLKDLMSVEESFRVAKKETTKDVYKMYIEVNGYKLRLKLRDRTEMISERTFESSPTSSIAVDKYYLTDVLKRFDSKEVFYLSIDLEGEIPEMVIRTTQSRHTIPIKEYTGEAKFTVTMQADLLSQLMFSHIRRSLIDGKELDEVKIEFEESDNTGSAAETVAIISTDPSKLWVTKYPKATKADAPLLDF